MSTPIASAAAKTTQLADNTAKPAATAFKGFDAGSFMKLLLAQLQHQNPLQPMDDKDMMAQMTQLNSLTELQGIKSAMENVASSNQFIYASNLIGKTIKASIAEGKTFEGTVTGISQVNGNIMLQVGEKEIPMASVLEVHGAAA